MNTYHLCFGYFSDERFKNETFGALLSFDGKGFKDQNEKLWSNFRLPTKDEMEALLKLKDETEKESRDNAARGTGWNCLKA